MGNADLSIHHKAIELIKKNEGIRYLPYEDKISNFNPKPFLVCYGNMFDGNNLIDRKKKYTHPECEKIIHNHYFKKVLPNIPKEYTGNRFIAVADMKYQYGEYARVTIKRIKSFPERGRIKLFREIKNY